MAPQSTRQGRRSGTRIRRVRSACLSAALMALCASTGCEADDGMDQFKAVYLYNFAKLTAWPASAPPAVLTVCFLGAEGLRALIERDISGKFIGARRIAVRALADSERAGDCGIVYVDAAVARAGLPAGAPSFALTVSDAGGFAHRGGMIELFLEGNRLRFIINLDNVRLAGLKMSSSLLDLASKVDQAASP